MIFILAAVSVLGLLPVGLGGPVAEDCTFPAFMETSGENYWMWNKQLNGEHIKLSVTGSTAAGVPLGWTDESWEPITYTCNSAGPAGEDPQWFLVDIEEVSEKQMCLQFEKITENVRKFSQGEPSDKDDCVDTVWTQDLLVASLQQSPGAEYHCPLQGGFLVDAVFNGTQGEQALCPNSPIRTRLEANCMYGAEMGWSFPDPACIPPQSGWSPEHIVSCLDSWTDDETGSEYTLIGNSYYDPVMCMQMNSNNETLLFYGLVCEEGGESVPFLNLTITQRGNTCDDEAISCQDSLCHFPLYADQCRHTCSACRLSPGLPSEPCSLPVEGTFTLYEDARDNETVTIGSGVLDLGGKVTYKCQQETEAGAAYLTSIDVQQGCRPMYSCVKVSQVNSAVVQYKISQCSATYEEDLCHERNFFDDPEPLRDHHHSRYLKTLINDAATETVPCGLGSNYTFNCTSEDQPQASLKAVSGSCVSANELTVDSCGFDSDAFQCLASLSFGSQQSNALITRGQGGAQCWLTASSWDSISSVSMLASPQCHEDTLAWLEEREVLLTADDLQEDGACAPSPSTSTPSTSTTISTTTTTRSGTSDYSTSDASGTGSSSSPEGTTETPQPSTEATGSGPATGRVAGIVIGSLLAVVALSAAAWFVWRWYRVARVPYRVL